jgi:hypothetical protein
MFRCLHKSKGKSLTWNLHHACSMRYFAYFLGWYNRQYLFQVRSCRRCSIRLPLLVLVGVGIITDASNDQAGKRIHQASRLHLHTEIGRPRDSTSPAAIWTSSSRIPRIEPNPHLEALFPSLPPQSSSSLFLYQMCSSQNPTRLAFWQSIPNILRLGKHFGSPDSSISIRIISVLP